MVTYSVYLEHVVDTPEQLYFCISNDDTHAKVHCDPYSIKPHLSLDRQINVHSLIDLLVHHHRHDYNGQPIELNSDFPSYTIIPESKILSPVTLVPLDEDQLKSVRKILEKRRLNNPIILEDFL